MTLLYSKYTNERIRIIALGSYIEEADFDVIKGVHETLSKFKPKLFVEFTERHLKKFNSTPTEMLNYIINFGYKPFVIKKSSLRPIIKKDNINNTNLFFKQYENCINL